MIVSPIVYSKIKEVVFQIYEPERRKDVMWGKPADEYYDFYLYVDGHWELIEGIGSSKVPIVPCNLSAFVNDAGYLSGSNVAYVESSSTASKSYSEGDYLIYGSTLYKATTAINEGDTIEIGVNVVSTTLTDEIGSGGGGGLQSFEFIACNITSVDGNHEATVDNTNWVNDAVAAYNAKKIPVLFGSVSSGVYYAMPLVVQPYETGGISDYKVYGSAAVNMYIGSGDYKQSILYAQSQTTHGGHSIYVTDFQDKLVSGTNIKTIDGTSLLGSGDIAIGVKEISASGTITGTIPNITIDINDYASFYADLVDANTQGKVPVVRMRLTQGGKVYEYSGIASSNNGWQFVGTFQMSWNYVSYNKFNRPTDAVPYKFDVVRLQEQLVSGTNIKTINSGSVLGSGNIEVMVDTEVIECNVTSVDSSGVATVSNTNWFTQAVAAYNNHKLPIVNGTYNYTPFTVQLTVVEDSPYNNCYGSTAVTEYIGSGQVRMFAINFMTTGNFHLVYVHDLQQQLTFDNTPTQNSDNPVKSGGVYSALAGKQDTLTFDSAPLENSTKPVYGGGIYSALKFKEDIPPIVDMTDSYSTETLTASVNTSNGLCTLSADPSDWAGDSNLSLGYTNPTTNKKEYRIVQYDYSNKQFTLPAYALGTSGTETISVTFYPRSIVSISGKYKAGRLYTFDTIVDTFSIVLAAQENATLANHYMIQFYYPTEDAGSNVQVSFNTNTAFPDGVKWMYGEPTFKPDNTYLVHFMNGLAWAETTEDILGGIDTVLDAILGSQVLNNGMERMLHAEEVAATLSPEIVHVFTGTTDTLAITLTAPTDTLSHLYTIILTTGTTPAVTIQVSDSTAIIYPDDYAIETGTTYEISVLYANGKYYLRYVSYQEA